MVHLVFHVLVRQLRPPRRLAVRSQRGRDLLAQRAVELGRRRGPRWRRARAPVLLELAHLPLVLRREVSPLLVSVRCERMVDGSDPVLEELALAQQTDRPIGREPRGLGLWRWLLARSSDGCSRTRLSLDVLKETAAVAAAFTECHGAKENENSDSHCLGRLSGRKPAHSVSVRKTSRAALNELPIRPDCQGGQ